MKAFRGLRKVFMGYDRLEGDYGNIKLYWRDKKSHREKGVFLGCTFCFLVFQPIFYLLFKLE